MKNLWTKWTGIALVKRILVGLILGAILGVAAPGATSIAILGDVFVGALKAIAPLLVFFLVISSLCNAGKSHGGVIKTVIILYMFSTVLAAVIAVGMFGCSQQNEQESSGQTTQETSDESGAEENTSTTDVSFSRSNEEIAKDFCTVWADKWAQIEEEGVTSNQQGRAFLEDMDNDGAKELIFLYDNDVNFNAVVYRISGDKTEELGTFVLSNTSPELNFTVYQGENGAILKHVAVRELTSETQNETEESYIMMEDGKVLQEILFSTTYDGVDTYYDSIMAGANEISLEEFDAMRQELLGDAQEVGNVTFTPEDFVDFSDSDALNSYLLDLLSK